MDFEQELWRIAQRYEAEGYTVVVRPARELLPPFVGDQVVDLLATRPDRRVLVVARRKRKDLAENPELAQLADVTNKQSGWRLDLVITEPENPIEKVAEKAHEPTGEQLTLFLDRAQQAASMGLPDMALVYAWAGLEAAMRRLRDDVELYGSTMPSELLRTLYSNGFLSREEFDRAREALKARTEIVHGFINSKIDPALLNDIIALARKIIGSEEPAASPS
jgi:hypothetical protein